MPSEVGGFLVAAPPDVISLVEHALRAEARGQGGGSATGGVYR